MSTTLVELSAQWQNPSEVTTVLMIIGGDMVQKALAQCTGTLYSPVCFSFGWVAFAFMALMGILGDGRLLPPPDHPVKVVNLESGYVRENKHWVIGRILRDHERSISRGYRLGGCGIRITVFEAVKPKKARPPNTFPYSWIHVFGAAVTVFQLVIASIPIILYKDWGIMLITAVGTALAIWCGSLPQWTVEKLPNRQHSKSVFALSSGNGSRDIMVIKGCGNCLDWKSLPLQTPLGTVAPGRSCGMPGGLAAAQIRGRGQVLVAVVRGNQKPEPGFAPAHFGPSPVVMYTVYL